MDKFIFRPLFFTILLLASKSFAESKPVHFVADSRLSLHTCTHKVRHGEWTLSILRNYGFAGYFAYSLVPLVQDMNKSINDINKLEPGEQLKIPVILATQRSINITDTKPCSQLIQTNQPIEYGKDSYVLLDRNQFYLYSFNPHSPKRPVADVREPSSAPLTTKPDFTPGSQVEFSIGGVFDTLEGTKGSSTIFVSELQPVIDLEWKQLWTTNWTSFLGINTILKNYTNFSNDVTTANNLKPIQSSFTAGLGYQLTQSFNLSTTLGFGESIFYTRNIDQTYSIKKEPSARIQIKGQEVVATQGPLSVAIDAQLEHISSGQILYGGGNNFGLGLELGHHREQSTLRGRIFYSEGYYKTNVLEFKQKLLMFQMTYEMGL